MPIDPFAVATFVVGTVVGAACVLASKRHLWLHAIPFVYSCIVELAWAAFQDKLFKWDGALVFGAAYYALGWMALFSARSYERKGNGN